MFPVLDAILSPDPRHEAMVFVDRATGVMRPMDIADLHWMVSPLQLDTSVPHDIREQFDKARSAFVYSWFASDLATLAEQQTYAVIEMALRERLSSEEPAARNKLGLAKLLKTAVVRGWLNHVDFDTGGINILDMLPMLRNELAHGSTHLMPYGTPDILRLGFDIIRKLFPDEAGGSRVD